MFTLILSLGTLPAQTTWTGINGTDWNDPGNWSTGIPDGATDVTIPDVTNDPTIAAGTNALAKSVTVNSGAVLTIAASASLEIDADGAPNGAIELLGTVENSGTITIGATASVGFFGFNIYGLAVLNNYASGLINIDRTTSIGIGNTGTSTNAGIINIGANASVGKTGIETSKNFINHAGGQINIDRSTDYGIRNHSGTFSNAGTITIGAIASQVSQGISSFFGSTFNNLAGATIHIDHTKFFGTAGTISNSGTIIIGANASASGRGLGSGFTNNAGGQVHVSNVVWGIRGGITNNGTITIGESGPVTLLIGAGPGSAPGLTNNTGGVLKGTGSIRSLRYIDAGGTLSPGYSPGTMSFDADEDFSNGSIDIEIAGMAGGGMSGGHDSISVSGMATLGGTSVLNVDFGSFVPTVGQMFTIIDATTVSGDFATINVTPSNFLVSHANGVLTYLGQCPPAGSVLYVNAAAGGGNTGGSWADAYNDLQDALSTATFCSNVTEIWVAEGTYKPTPGTDRTQSFVMKNGVSIYGGFPNMGNPTMSDRDWENNVTILSGDIGTANDNSDNSYHVIANSGLDNTAVLDGFTIAAGNAIGGGTYDYGGGMKNLFSQTKVANCTFSNNHGNYGGGLYNVYGNPELNNCTFLNNTSDFGAGMYNSSGAVPQLDSCTFTGNVAGQNGGGLYNESSANAALTSCEFIENSAGRGGAVSNYSGAGPSFTKCTFRGNEANDNGGAIHNEEYSSPTFTNCLFSGNAAISGRGGAIFNYFLDNPYIVNCTFSGNSSALTGGAISSESSYPSILNCILWGNSSEIFETNGSSTFVRYSIVQGGFLGTGNLDEDPLFADMPDHTAAPTTMGDLHTTDCSPAIDAGEDATNMTTEDLDGNARKVDAIAGGEQIDMGAYERLSLGFLTWYIDADADDYGSSTVQQCERPTDGFLLSELLGDGDCNDGDGDINPGATEVCDNIDNDCDGDIDNDDDNLVDNDAPEALCKTHTVQLDASGQINLAATDIDNGSNDACGIASLSASPNTFTCGDVGNVTVTLTVTDNNGNQSTCEATVTVEDNVMPSANCKNITVQLDASGNATIAEDAVNDGSSDACGGLAFDTDITSFDCDNVPSANVTLTVTDANGNSDNCSATVTVGDNVMPSANCTTTTIQAVLDANANYTVNPTDLNDGSTDACGGLAFSASPSLLTCQSEGANTVTLTVTDANGNSSNCTATVEVGPFITNINISHTDETCDGMGDGTITVSADALGGQVRYSIDGGVNFSPNGQFNQVSPGTYSIVIKVFGIPNICEATATSTVADGPAITVWYKDMDNDGYTDGITQAACTQPTGYVANALPGDCNDYDPNAFPGQVWYRDSDGDNYTDGSAQTTCSRPADHKTAAELVNTTDIDCDDNDPAVNHGATEVCNGIDDDCDGEVDEGTSGGLTYVGNIAFTTQAAVDAFSPCYSIIDGNLTIIGAGINDLSSLSNLEEVTGNVNIQSTGLTDLDGLDNLTDIGGTLTIFFNSLLTTLDGFDNLASVGGSLFMYYNFQLSDCCAFYDLLNNGGVSGPVVVFFNKVGCNSQADILACPPPSPLIASNTNVNFGDGTVSAAAQRMRIYPNPTNSIVNVAFDAIESIALLEIRNGLGQVLFETTLEAGTDRWSINLDNGQFANGVYFVSLLENGARTTRRLVVQY